MARTFASGDVIVGSNSGINFERNQAFSVHLLARITTATSVAESLLGHLDTANNFRGWEIEKTNGGTPGAIVVYLINNFGGLNRIFKRTSTVPTHDGSVFTAIGFTYTGSSTAAGLTVYLNGAAASIAATDDALSATMTNAVALRFGKRLDGTEPFTGTMGEVGIWNVALSAGEMASLGGTGVVPYTVRPGALTAYFPLFGLASPEPDLSGSANNGTLTGTSLGNHPPTTLWTPKSPLFLASAAPSFIPAWAVPSNYISSGGYAT